MKKAWFAAMLLLAIGWTCCVGAAEPFTLAPGESCQIVLPEEKAGGVPRHLRRAAVMLQTALERGLQSKVSVTTENAAVSGIKAIYLGNTQALQQAGYSVKELPDFGFLIAEKGGKLFIAGQDKRCFNRPDDRPRSDSDYILGSVNGAVKFAEQYLKVRFLYPGEDGIDYAENLPAISIPAGFEKRVNPPLLYSSRYGEMFYNYANNGYGFGSVKHYGGHTYWQACSRDVYGKTHPEYFILTGGKRVNDGNHLCISNPEVQELIYQELIKQIDAGAEIVQLGPTDGLIPCECENCRNLFGVTDIGEQLWIFHRKLAEKVAAARPGKKIMMLAYEKTILPPKSFKEFPENTMVEFCAYSPEYFDLWRDYRVPGGFTAYVYNWGWYNISGLLPKRSPEYCAQQIRLFAKENVRGIYRCGGRAENPGLEGMNHYIYGHLLNDSKQDLKALQEDFLTRAFHESAAPMRSFFAALNRRMDMFAVQQNATGISQEIVNPRVMVTAVFSPDMLETLERNLTRAEALAVRPEVKSRLLLVRTEFDYAKNLATCLAFYNAYRINPTPENFKQLGDKIRERNAMIDSFYEKNDTKPYSSRWPDLRILGNPPRNMMLQNGRLSGIIGAPLNWNVDFLEAQHVLPGTAKKSAEVLPVQGELSGSDFESGAWQRAAWLDLGGIQLGAVREKSRFKLLYDQKNLYIAMETEVPEAQTFIPVGQDGPAYHQDCIEVLLDPTGSGEVYYHLIWNPVENSRYDEACGLIQDVLHPLFNQPDPAWNGNWSYTTTRRGDKWLTMLSVPFADLGAEVPGPGSIWQGNVGRESYRSAAPELSLWSPNLETMSFQDPESFGKLIFK